MILHALFLNSVFWSHPLSPPCRVFDAFFLPRELWLNQYFFFRFSFRCYGFSDFCILLFLIFYTVQCLSVEYRYLILEIILIFRDR